MSLVLADRVRQTSTTTGSGTLTLDGSVTGFQSFSAIGDGNTTYYTISLDAQWEVGIGTYSAGTLTRDTVISSSTGSKIAFAAGTKDVFVTLPSQKAVTTGSDAVLTKLTTPTVQATNSGGLSLKNSAGTTQISMGGGGGDNVSVNVSTNMNGSNAQIDISPTGTGHVHMKPSGTGSIEVAPTNVGTMDNMTIGGVTPKAITGTTITATSFSGSGSGLTSIPNSALTNSSITINGVATSLGGTTNVGTVTSASIVSANGFAGTVATDTTTPAITLSTSITGVLKGNGTAISAASAGTDYQAPITLTTTGTSGAATFVGNTLNIPQYSGGGGGSGTVTSVAATVPAFLSVTGSPITTSGTLAISYSGTALPIANGGTGQTTSAAAITALTGTQTSGYYLRSDGTNAALSAIQAADVPTLNQNTTGTASNVTGTVAIANGGTGATTQQAAINALAGSVQNSRFLAGNGTNVTMRAIAASDVPTLNQDTTGTAANITAATNSTLTTLSALSLPGSQVSGNISGNAANVTGTIAIGSGGTGQTTASAGFNALSPITTTGDLILGNGTNSATRLAIGTDGQALISNGSTAVWGSAIASATAVNTTSGTSIDFTGIPSWVKRITAVFSAISSNGTSSFQFQLGTTSGVTATGYDASLNSVASTATGVAFSTGFGLVNSPSAAGAYSGQIILTLLDATSNFWGATSTLTSGSTTLQVGGGGVSLASTLTRVRLTTVGGTNTFDAGKMNILFE
jgi:hypothetical protein